MILVFLTKNMFMDITYFLTNRYSLTNVVVNERENRVYEISDFKLILISTISNNLDTHNDIRDKIEECSEFVNMLLCNGDRYVLESEERANLLLKIANNDNKITKRLLNLDTESISNLLVLIIFLGLPLKRKLSNDFSVYIKYKEIAVDFSINRILHFDKVSIAKYIYHYLHEDAELATLEEYILDL